MRPPFKTIGIVGGAGPLGSVLLYKMIIDYCQHHFHAKEDYEFPKIVLVNYPFSSMVELDDSKQNRDKIIVELQSACDLLRNAKAEIVGIACNTLHTFVDKVNLDGVEFIHLIDATINQLKQQSIQKVVFLGTPTSITGNLYGDKGVDVVYPNQVEQKIISRTIHAVLDGSYSERDAHNLANVVKTIGQRNDFEGIVLGCTELPVLHKDYPVMDDLGIPVFDTLQILAQNLVEKSRL